MAQRGILGKEETMLCLEGRACKISGLESTAASPGGLVPPESQPRARFPGLGWGRTVRKGKALQGDS